MKRLSYILKLQRSGKTETTVYISKKKERIVIDSDVIAVIEIMDEIIQYEEVKWRKKIFVEIRKGYKDISIIPNSPMERTKYYETKKEFVDKIYQCCIYKRLVDYEDILKTRIG